jgi:Ca-activated chloride channel homolog
MNTFFCILLLSLGYASPIQAFDWQSLWQRSDQRGLHYLQNGQPAKAAEAFEDPHWQATARYRQGEYQQAANLLAAQHGDTAHYNRGNALAHAGQLESALEAYQQALANNPKHTDARFNHDTLKNWLEKQQQEQPPKPSPDDAMGEDEQSSENAQSQPGNSPQEQPQAGDSSSEQPPQSDQANAQPQQKPSEQAKSNPQPQASPQKDHTTEAQPDVPPSENFAEKSPPDAITQPSTPQEKPQSPDDTPTPDPSESTESREQRQAAEQWLRKIPDDPGALFREKLRREYLRGNYRRNEQKIW